MTLDVRAGIGQQVFQNGPGRFLVIAMLWWCGGGTERLFQKRHAHALGTADFLQRGGVHGLPFIISANRASRTQMTLPSSAKPGDRLIQEGLLSLVISPRLLGQVAESPPECRQHFSGMARIEEIDRRRCSAFDKSTSSSRMKRVAAIQKSSRTMTMHWTRPPSHCRRACDQFGVFVAPAWHAAIARTGRGRSALSCRAEYLALVAVPPAILSGSSCLRRCWTALPQSMQQTGFGFFRCGFDVNRQITSSESRGNSPALTSDDLPQPDGP